MGSFDRVISLALVAGIWALVLQPNNLTEHHSAKYSKDNTRKCAISGQAFGFVSASRLYVDNFQGVFGECGAS